MKKLLSLALAVSLGTLTLAGCVANKPNTTSSVAGSSAATVTEGNLKTGLAVITSLAKSKDAGTEDGLAQVDSTVVAVTVDKDGKIVGCFIDAAQTKINFSNKGKLTTDLKTEYKTKMEQGATYGMQKASGIGKEWNEQATAFANYVIGKTVDEVKGIAVNDEGAPKGDDLKASVTVAIGGFVSAIEKAVAGAKDMGAKAGDKLGLGIITTISKSKDAGTEEGLAQAYSTYAAVTFNGDSKITSCIIDGSQGNVNFSTAGKISTNLTVAPKTKLELGDAYGMKKASGIGKEWNEQANAFSQYVLGKTVAQVKGIAVDEKTSPTGDDLKTSVTVSIGGFMTVIEKAGSNAK